MITLVLDGYNVIHAVPELARQLDRSLEAAREALVALCGTYLARRGDVTRLYVVFDGNDVDAPSSRADRGGVTVLFTPRQEEADARILSLIRSDGGRSRFVIVSNDTYIFNNARVHGARVMPVREFYAQVRPARTSQSKGPVGVEKMPLSSRDEQRITEEYRQSLEGKTKNRVPRRSI